MARVHPGSLTRATSLLSGLWTTKGRPKASYLPQCSLTGCWPRASRSGREPRVIPGWTGKFCFFTELLSTREKFGRVTPCLISHVFYVPSHPPPATILALHFSPAVARSAIRFSVGRETTI